MKKNIILTMILSAFTISANAMAAVNCAKIDLSGVISIESDPQNTSIFFNANATIVRNNKISLNKVKTLLPEEFNAVVYSIYSATPNNDDANDLFYNGSKFDYGTTLVIAESQTTDTCTLFQVSERNKLWTRLYRLDAQNTTGTITATFDTNYEGIYGQEAGGRLRRARGEGYTVFIKKLSY
jgi:hypothetical protein